MEYRHNFWVNWFILLNRLEMFVGRRKLIEKLLSIADEVLYGESKTVHVRGSKGIGKTTLLRKFLNELPENFVRFKTSHLMPFDNIVRTFIKNFGNRRRLIMRILTPNIAETYPYVSEYYLYPFEARKRNEFYAIYDLLHNLSEFYPIVVVFDNAESLSRDDLEIVKNLSISLEEKPIMFVVSSTNELNLYKAITIDVPPLSFEEILELGYDMETSEKLYEISAGNPSILRQLLFYMETYGKKPEEFNKEILKELFQKIYSELSDEEKEYLKRSALTNKFQNIPRSLIDKGILDEEGFRLSEFKEFVLEKIPKEERESFHRLRALELMESTKIQEDETTLYELIQHMELANLQEAYPELYSKYSLTLAKIYKDKHKYELSLDFLKKVISEPFRKEAKKLELYINITLGRWDEVEKLYEQLPKEDDVKRMYARYLLSRRKFSELEEYIKELQDELLYTYLLYHTGNVDEFLRKALKLVESNVDVSEKFNLLNLIASSYRIKGLKEEAKFYYKRLLSLGKAYNEPTTIARALYNLAVMNYETENYDEALNMGKEALEISKRAGYTSGQMFSHYMLGVMSHERGEYDISSYHFQKAYEISSYLNNDFIRISSTYRLMKNKEEKEQFVANLMQNLENFGSFKEMIVYSVIVPYYVESCKFKEVLKLLKKYPPTMEYMRKYAQALESFARKKDLEVLDVPLLVKAQLYEMNKETVRKAIEIYRKIGFIKKVMELQERFGIEAPVENQSVEVRTFGGLSILRNGMEIPKKQLPSGKALQLLVILLKGIWEGRKYSSYEIAYIMWPDADEDKALRNLHVYVNTLRKLLTNEGIVRESEFYYIDTNVVKLDILPFRMLVEEARKEHLRNRIHKAYELYSKAISIAKGDFLKGCTDIVCEELSTSINREIVRALEFLARYEFERENYEDAMDHAYRILKIDPYNDEAHMLIYKALRNQGKEVKAFEYLSKVRDMFEREIGFLPQSLKEMV